MREMRPAIMSIMIPHGTHSGYAYHKCRCNDCREAQRIYQLSVRPEVKVAVGARYREKHKDRARASVLRYSRSIKGKMRSERRRARKYEAFVENINRDILYDMHEGVCGICGWAVSRTTFHVDHVIPLSKGGLPCYANVQPAHPVCNLRKGNR